MEEQPAPTVRMETPAPVKAVPVPPLAGDLLTIDKPIRLELIRIPAGEFLMGDDKHLVDVAEFYIGKYPVTNAQYAAFVQAKNYDRPKHWKDGRIPAGKENHPVVYVSWDDSVAFCEWLSQATGRTFRLPTEAEWEKAARGGLRIPGLDGALMDNPLPARTYPWGDKFSKDKCNVSESGAADTTPVDEYSPAGDSPYGVADMAGNVWEWVEDWYRLSRNYHVLRGGSWNDDQDDDASQFRSDTFRPMYLYDDRGFRVVAGLAPAS
jgi:formylglycine-generating enzyme required for sulfatase activity